MMRSLLQDLRFGARMLAKNPGFTAVAVLTLALGIGANTAIFSLVDATLLRPLPYRQAERLIMVWEDLSQRGIPRNNPSPANYADWKAQNSVFEDMAAFRNQFLNLTGSGEPLQLEAHFATANIFSVLGVTPSLGRFFLPADDQPGAPKVAVLSYRLWQQNFGGDPQLVGKSILLDNEKYSVVGVLPRDFFFDPNPDIWTPIAFSSSALAVRWVHYLRVVARLKPGVSIERAQAEMSAIGGRLAQAYPESNKDAGVVLVPIRDQFVGNLRPAVLMLLAAVAFVLLIACANLANLLLARGTSRQKEMALRAALGSRRLRLMRQLLTESVLLSLLGGALGVLLGGWGFTFVRRMLPQWLGILQEFGLSASVLAFTALLCLLTGVMFGLAPALRISGANLSAALKEGGHSGISSRSRLQSALVAAEVAVAFVLLITATLMVRTLSQLHNVDLGFRPEQVLTLRSTLPQGQGSKYNDLAARSAFYRDVLSRVRSLPGVTATGYITFLPLTNPGGTTLFLIEGRPEPPPGQSNQAIRRVITPDYPRAMRIPLRAGRLIAESDGPEAPPVVLINETAARRYWPEEDPVGKRIKRFVTGSGSSPWVTVVGVLGDVRQAAPETPPLPEIYFSYQQAVGSFGFYVPRDLAVRVAGDPLSIAAAVQQQIWAVDKNQPVTDVRTMDAVVAEKLKQRDIQTGLLGTFSALGLALAAVGLYGVLAYVVAQRTREIGVRMALGAQPADILRIVIRKGMKWVFLGCAIGLVGSLAASRLTTKLLFGVSPVDPVTFAGVFVALVAAGLAACYVPARRAAKIDPIVALRYE